MSVVTSTRSPPTRSAASPIIPIVVMMRIGPSPPNTGAGPPSGSTRAHPAATIAAAASTSANADAMRGALRSVPHLADEYVVGHLAPDDVRLAADLDREAAAERLGSNEPKRGAGNETEPADVAEQVWIAVGDLDHCRRAPRLELAHADAERALDGAVASGDGRAVRVTGREAEPLVDPFLDLLREHVLPALCLGVHLVPGDAEHLGEEALDQTVVADDLERDLLAGAAQDDAAVRLVRDEAEAGELLDHGRRRRGRNPEPAGERGRRRRARLLVELVDRLEVVLDRLCAH